MRRALLGDVGGDRDFAVGIDQAGIGRLAGQVDHAGIGRRLHVGADRFDHAVADDDRAFLDHLARLGDDPHVGQRDKRPAYSAAGHHRRGAGRRGGRMLRRRSASKAANSSKRSAKRRASHRRRASQVQFSVALTDCVATLPCRAGDCTDFPAFPATLHRGLQIPACRPAAITMGPAPATPNRIPDTTSLMHRFDYAVVSCSSACCSPPVACGSRGR